MLLCTPFASFIYFSESNDVVGSWVFYLALFLLNLIVLLLFYPFGLGGLIIYAIMWLGISITICLDEFMMLFSSNFLEEVSIAQVDDVYRNYGVSDLAVSVNFKFPDIKFGETYYSIINGAPSAFRVKNLIWADRTSSKAVEDNILLTISRPDSKDKAVPLSEATQLLRDIFPSKEEYVKCVRSVLNKNADNNLRSMLFGGDACKPIEYIDFNKTEYFAQILSNDDLVMKGDQIYLNSGRMVKCEFEQYLSPFRKFWVDQIGIHYKVKDDAIQMKDLQKKLLDISEF